MIYVIKKGRLTTPAQNLTTKSMKTKPENYFITAIPIAVTDTPKSNLFQNDFRLTRLFKVLTSLL